MIHRLLFACMLVQCCIATVAAGNIFIKLQPDLRPFKVAMQTALERSGSLNTSKCNIPDGAIMYTLSNQHLFPLLAIRHEAMAKKGVLDCLQQRFITACLDAKCFALCQTHKFSNCAFIDIPETPYTAFGAHATEYQKNSYSYIVWLKWETMFSALSVAKEVFYMDADVVLLGNPFPDTRFGRDESGHRLPGVYDIMYQRERGMSELGCGGSVNGGLIYMRNSTDVQEKLIPAITKHKQDMIQLTGQSDQDLVGMYVKLVKFCTLPVERFMGYCVSSRLRQSNPMKVITFHTNCVSGLSNKMRIIQAFVHRAIPGAYALDTLQEQQAVRRPRYRPTAAGPPTTSTTVAPGTVARRFWRMSGDQVLMTFFGYFLYLFGGMFIVWMLCQYNLNRRYSAY